MLIHTAQLPSHLRKWGIALASCSLWQTTRVCHTCCGVTYLLNLFIAHLWPLYLPSSHTAICSVATTPPSTLLSTHGGLPAKWFLLFLPNLEFQLQIYPSKSAKGRQSQCQTRSSFPVGRIFNSVTVAEKESWLPSERGRIQHCKKNQQLCPVQEEQIVKGFKTVISVGSEK